MTDCDAIREALVKWTHEQMSNCPACGSLVRDVENFDGAVHGFVCEATFSCGSAVKVSARGGFDVGTACPVELQNRLDELAQEIEDELAEAAAP